jgi:hypothetical protein
MIMMLPFSIFRRAVFAEPSVTEIEEVIGLVHKRGGSPILRDGCRLNSMKAAAEISSTVE